MYSAQLPALLLLVSGVAATAVPSDEHFAALLARQAPGTPKFECHSNCGSAITGSRTSGYCTNTTWLEAYNACIACAREFDIWQHYGNSVGAAGTSCGLSTDAPSSATPSTSAADDEPAAAVTTTTSPLPATVTDVSTTADDTPAASTADSLSPSASAPPAAETTTTPPAAGAGSNATSAAPSPSSTFVTVSGAHHMTGSLLGLGAMVVLGLKALW